MTTRIFYVSDRSGIEHEIMLENAVGRYYEAFKDGVKEYFIAECLSFEAAFREYCARKNMIPATHEAVESQNRKKSSDRFPVNCLATLEILHDLFKKEMISRSELESMKTKILSYFSAKF